MRRRLTGVVVLLALAGAGAWAQGQPQLPANGLYEIVDSGRKVAKTVDGGTIRLGKKLKRALGSPILASQSNDNQQYVLLYALHRNDPEQVALYADGFCLTILRTVNEVEFSSDAAAQAFAKYLGIPVHLRARPDYALTTRFVPMKTAFSGEEPVIVTLEIDNVGHVPVTFWAAEASGRDNQFGFTAQGPLGHLIPDTGNQNSNPGDFFDASTLARGETFRKEVDLRDWFNFSQPGVYQLTGAYEMEFYNLGEGAFPIWQHFAAASFTVTIK